MAAITMGLAEAKNNFSKVTNEVNRTGKPVTVLKNNKPWVIIQPAQAHSSHKDAVDIAVNFMNRNDEAFKELSEN